MFKLSDVSSKPVNMFLALRCTTLDIITAYMFGRCADTLHYPEFKAPMVLNIQAALPLLWTIKSFPLIVPVLAVSPRWLARGMYDQFQGFISIVDFLTSSLDRTAEEASYSLKTSNNHPTVFGGLWSRSETVSPDAFAKIYLDESLSLLQAGSDPVANTCMIGMFCVLNDKRVLSKLTTELESCWPDENEDIEMAVLQGLPYLVSARSKFCTENEVQSVNRQRL